MRLALDVMGGDHAPDELLAGAVNWIKHSDSSIILVGNEEIIESKLKNYNYDKNRIEIVHASQVVGMDESPVVALRKKKDSSIVVASNLVKNEKADAVLSCGSTGAQMAAAIFILGRLNNVERPPIVATIPNNKGSYSFMLDVGANVDCRPGQLLQFALLGKVYASILLGIDKPRVALLNNGEEEGKGNNLAVETYKLLKNQPGINFVGNIEGRGIFSAQADVIVCDGFAGNVVLKAVEGMAILAAQSCKKEVKAVPSFFKDFDYSSVGGAPLLGVDGISIVCHGSSKREAVFNGIKLADECVNRQLLTLQKEALLCTK